MEAFVMRSLTVMFLALPSFIGTSVAEEADLRGQQYRKLGVQMACARDCDQLALKARSEGAAPNKVERQFSTCRMECSDAFNRTSSIKAAPDAVHP
jgi:predicted secreted protein